MVFVIWYFIAITVLLNFKFYLCETLEEGFWDRFYCQIQKGEIERDRLIDH